MMVIQIYMKQPYQQTSLTATPTPDTHTHTFVFKQYEDMMSNNFRQYHFFTNTKAFNASQYNVGLWWKVHIQHFSCILLFLLLFICITVKIELCLSLSLRIKQDVPYWHLLWLAALNFGLFENQGCSNIVELNCTDQEANGMFLNIHSIKKQDIETASTKLADLASSRYVVAPCWLQKTLWSKSEPPPVRS